MTDWQALKPWIKQLGSYRVQVALGLLFALATVLMGVGLLSLSGWFITASALYVGFDIYTPGGGIRFFALSRTLGRYVERLINHDLVLKLQARWRIALYKSLQKQPIQRTLGFRVADTVQQLTRNLDAMDNLLLRLIVPLLVFGISSLILAAFWMFYASWLGLVLLIAMVVVLLVTYWLAGKTRRSAARQLEQQYDVRQQVMNVTESATELDAWGRFNRFAQQGIEAAETLEREDLTQLRWQQRAQLITEVIGQCVLVATLLLMFAQFQEDNVSAAQVVMLVLAALAWQEIAVELPNQWAGYGKTVAAAKRLLPDQSKSSTEVDTTSTNDKPFEPVDVTLQNLTVARHSRRLIDDLTATLKHGNVHWIEGPSGIGKSSLADVIMGHLMPEQGSILGNDAQLLSRSQVAYLTQDTQLLSASVRHNLNPSQQQLADSDYWEVLKLVAMDSVIRQLEAGLDTPIGDKGVPLSGGQQRRLALSRVLLQQRPVVLLDEPFTGIERELIGRILVSMQQAYPAANWIIISHVTPDELDVSAVPMGERIQMQ